MPNRKAYLLALAVSYAPCDESGNTASLGGVDDAHLRLLRSRAVVQPFGTYTQPLRLENPAREELLKLGILCGFSLDHHPMLVSLVQRLSLRTAGSSL